jgi:hypothetical protein
VEGLLAHPVLANNTTASNLAVGHTVPQNLSATNTSVLALPKMYYFGVSGNPICFPIFYATYLSLYFISRAAVQKKASLLKSKTLG